MKDWEKSVDQLASGLQPVSVAPSPGSLAVLWLAASALFVVLATHWLGPIRAGAGDQLAQEWRFALEMVLGVVAAVALAAAAFRAASPGRLGRGLLAFALVTSGLWVAGFGWGLMDPALEPSMAGKRDHCLYETFLIGLLPLLAACYWQRRLYALRPYRASLLAGLAAGILPALYMQVACMYDPAHILAFHVAPGVLLAACAPLVLATMTRFSRG